MAGARPYVPRFPQAPYPLTSQSPKSTAGRARTDATRRWHKPDPIHNSKARSKCSGCDTILCIVLLFHFVCANACVLPFHDPRTRYRRARRSDPGCNHNAFEHPAVRWYDCQLTARTLCAARIHNSRWSYGALGAGCRMYIFEGRVLSNANDFRYGARRAPTNTRDWTDTEPRSRESEWRIGRQEGGLSDQCLAEARGDDGLSKGL